MIVLKKVTISHPVRGVLQAWIVCANKYSQANGSELYGRRHACNHASHLGRRSSFCPSRISRPRPAATSRGHTRGARVGTLCALVSISRLFFPVVSTMALAHPPASQRYIRLPRAARYHRPLFPVSLNRSAPGPPHTLTVRAAATARLIAVRSSGLSIGAPIPLSFHVNR